MKLSEIIKSRNDYLIILLHRNSKNNLRLLVEISIQMSIDRKTILFQNSNFSYKNTPLISKLVNTPFKEVQ